VVVAGISAGIAFLSLLGTMYFASKASSASKKSLENANLANQNAERANQIATGQTETSLRELISSTRTRMEDAGYKIQDLLQGRSKDDLDEAQLNHLGYLEASWRSAVEDHLNAYEDACGKFLDEKTDPSRFKKAYVNEIQTLCSPSHESFVRLLHPESTSKYEAIWKVYRTWHRHE